MPALPKDAVAVAAAAATTLPTDVTVVATAVAPPINVTIAAAAAAPPTDATAPPTHAAAATTTPTDVGVAAAVAAPPKDATTTATAAPAKDADATTLQLTSPLSLPQQLMSQQQQPPQTQTANPKKRKQETSEMGKPKKKVFPPFNPRPQIAYTPAVARSTTRYINAGLFVGNTQGVLEATAPDPSTLPDIPDEDGIDGECMLVLCEAICADSWNYRCT